MPAVMGGVSDSIIGPAAAGISVFYGGRAGFPVADPVVVPSVFFTARAGVLIDAPAPGGGCWFMGSGWGCGWCWHGITRELI